MKTISVVYSTSDEPVPASSITASVSKDFYVGETITKSDIVVKDNLNRIVTDYSFANYTFTYDDAASGGEVTEKDFEILYENLETELSVDVSRKAYSSTIEYLVKSSVVFNTIGGSNDKLKDGTVTYDGITYQYYQSYYYTSNAAISFGNSSSITGYFKNNTPFSSKILDVDINKTGRNVNVRVSTNGSNWTLYANANFSTNDYRYFKIDCVDISGSNYANIRSVTLTLDATKIAEPLANYIMYEDTENQCTSKFSVAKGYFEGLSQEGRSDFMTSTDYVISTARERFLAWAQHEGKTISLINGDYVVLGAKTPAIIGQTIETPTLIVIVISSIGIAALGGYLFIRRYKQK